MTAEHHDDSIIAICAHLATTVYDSLPVDVIETAKRLIVDTIAVTLAGREAIGIRNFIGVLESWGGVPESSIMLGGERLPSSEAVLANVALASALQLGNCHSETAVQPIASTLWSAAAFAEARKGVSGKEFVTAIVLGSDLIIRMAKATSNSRALGHHPAIYSGFGAAATVGILSRFNAETLRNSLGIMLSQASATMQAARDDVQANYLQFAFNASDGFQSAVMAGHRVIGVRRVIDGEFGFARMFGRGEADHSALIGGLGTDYSLRELTRVPDHIVSSCPANIVDLVGRIEQLTDVSCIFDFFRMSLRAREQ